MKILTVTAIVVVIALCGAEYASAGQHEEHQMAAAAGTCDQAAQQTAQTLDVLNARLEAARQTNSPSQMRAAMDDLQAALGSMKAQLSGCTARADAAGTMPGMQHGASGNAAALRPDSAQPSPAAQAATPVPEEPSRSAQSRASSSAVTSSSQVEISLKTRPSPPTTGANEFEVTVKRSDGKAISDADVFILFVMPAMSAMKMPEMRNEVKLKAAGDGKYTGTGQVMMAGQWNVTISVKQKGKEIGQKKLVVTTE